MTVVMGRCYKTDRRAKAIASAIASVVKLAFGDVELPQKTSLKEMHWFVWSTVY